MKKKRILFAAVDIGYRIEHYTKFINTHLSDKLIAESFSKYVLPESHYKTKYTYSCPIDKTHPIILYLYSFGFFIFSLFRYDIFHFLSGETILTRKFRRFELAIYKLFGKKIIMHFVGADIRSANYLEWKRKNLVKYLKGNMETKLTENYQDKLIADTRKYADHILVSTPDLLKIIPEAIYFPVLLDLESLCRFKDAAISALEERDCEKIIILHAPSGLKTKGSEYIHSALDLIEKEFKGRIEIIVPGKLTNKDYSYSLTRYELIEQMKRADIVVDQMVIGWFGLKTIEALALGCDVISYIDDNLKKHLYPDSPIISADVLTLEGVLRDLIKKKLRNSKMDIANYDWVKKYYSIENNNNALIHAWFN